LLICQMPKDCTIIPKPQSKGKTSKPRHSPLFATFESIRFILKGQDNALSTAAKNPSKPGTASLLFYLLKFMSDSLLFFSK
jgi:hypothetical protein